MNVLCRRVLISVSDKTGISEFARSLVERGYDVVSTGGTWNFLSKAGLSPTKVSDVTGFPEILDGRVKTLHPHIHAALLARHDLPEHRAQLDDLGIAPFCAVVVNLYPFAQSIAREGASVSDSLEQIDIGGPAMIRAAAKNFQNVSILTDPADYASFLVELDESGMAPLDTRLRLAQKAFQHTFAYDLKIANWLDQVAVSEDEQVCPLVLQGHDLLPETFRLCAQKTESLRYGENPHQRAATYSILESSLPDYVTQHQGKHLSYNNLADMDAAWRCVSDFNDTTAVVVKHTNPCGVASHANLEQAFRRARQVDSVSAFGGVIAFNRAVDKATACAVLEVFTELVIAPSFDEDARKLFKRKKNLRLLEVKVPNKGLPASLDFKMLDHALLLQAKDLKRVPFEEWRLVSERVATPDEVSALRMAWSIVAHVKSNGIVYANAEGALGMGVGQMNRVDSARLGLVKAAAADLSVLGCAMASDAFFPFRDSIDTAANAGVLAIVEPGGSIRDAEVIQAANEHGICLYFTETRHFRH